MIKARIVIALLLMNSANVSAYQEGQGQFVSGPLHLIPVPATLQSLSGRLKIDAAFTVAVVGHRDARLDAAIDRAARRLERRPGFEFSRAPARASQHPAF